MSDDSSTVTVDTTQQGSDSASWLALPAAVAAVTGPLLVAAVVLTQRAWSPTLDMAMTEIRIRDVGTRRTPLIGLPGRIGDFPDQGSHPGPASFYLVKPFHWLSGGRSWGMEVGSAIINAVAAIATLLIARRAAGRGAMVAIAAVLAIAVRGYGLSVLTHPWNPYFPLILWLLTMVATWAVLLGHSRMIVVAVVAGSIAAQTHVPYLLPAVAMCGLAFVVLLVRWRRDDDRDAMGAALVSLGVVAIGWLPSFVDQIRRDPGNISMLIEHFTGDTDEQPIGLVDGFTVLVRHLDLPTAAWKMIIDDQAFLEISGRTSGPAIGGVAVLVALLVSAAAAWRLRHRPLIALHGVVALGLVVAWFSMSRIFGKVWYYLTLWAWGTSLLAAVAIGWTIVAWWKVSSPRLEQVGIAAIAVPTALSLVAAPSLQPPESNLSDGVSGAIEATVAAIDGGLGDAMGPDGRYVVFWQDANFIGAQGYGMVNELDRRGYEVGVHPTWRVPVTPYRVFENGTYDAEVHVISEFYVDEWRSRPGYVEVVTVDPLDTEHRAEFDRLRLVAIEGLTAAGRDDLVQRLDVNLFGTAIDPTLPSEVLDELERMLVLTTPVTVFIAPPDSTF